jgi:hypothetical protein
MCRPKVLQVADIPRTKSGKIVELAVRHIVHGRPVKNVEALANPEALVAHSSTLSLPIKLGRSVRTAGSAMKKALVPMAASMVSIRFARLGFLANHAVVCGTMRRHSFSIFSAVAILQGALTSRVEPILQRLGGIQASGSCLLYLIRERKNNK